MMEEFIMTMTEFLKNKIKDFIESKKVWCDAEQTDDFMNEIYDSLNNLKEIKLEIPLALDGGISLHSKMLQCILNVIALEKLR